jgi:hypothetical protein
VSIKIKSKGEDDYKSTKVKNLSQEISPESKEDKMNYLKLIGKLLSLA